MDRLRIYPERHVVHEHLAVDLGQVDATLATTDKRIEGTDDVGAVDTEVESEVVAGARRDAHERETVLSGDPGDDRLGAIATCRGEGVGTPGDGVAHQHQQIVAGAELNWFDAPGSSLVVEVHRSRLAAAGRRVPHHHGSSGRGRWRQRHAEDEGPPRGHRGDRKEDAGDDQLHQHAIGQQHDECRGEQDDGDDGERRPTPAAPLDCLQRSDECQDEQSGDEQPTREAPGRGGHDQDDRRRAQHQRRNRSGAARLHRRTCEEQHGDGDAGHVAAVTVASIEPARDPSATLCVACEAAELLEHGVLVPVLAQ